MRAILRRALPILLLASLAGTPLASAWEGEPHAVVKVWDTAVPIPPSLSLGLTPGESVEDPDGLAQQGTGVPTIVTVYARSSHPEGLSGVSFWNPDGNVFVWYGKTMAGLAVDEMTVSSGFPGGVDINRGGGPVLAGGPFGTSFGAGDVWVGGFQNEPLYVLMAGTDPVTGAGRFRTYGTNSALLPPTSHVWGVEVDEATGNVFVAQPDEGRVLRLHPPDGLTTAWQMQASCNGMSCGGPIYVTVDTAGRPYATTARGALGDAIVRVNPGADGALGRSAITGVSDDTISLWPVPSQPAFRAPPRYIGDPEENPNGLITVDSTGNVWFSESYAHKIGRLNPANNEICEYTTPGLLNPQQIAATGSGDSLQVFFTEGEGNSVSVLTQAEADLAVFPNRVCTTVAPYTVPVPVQDAVARMFDEVVLPLRTAIVPTLHDVAPVGGSGIVRLSPMPNPILSADGTPIGDAGNGFPSGMTGVYADHTVAGAYLKGNKHFQLQSQGITAPPSPHPGGLPGRMTGGGRLSTAGGSKVTYGLVLLCATGQRGNDALQVNWGDGTTFHLTRVDAASCSDDPAITPDPRGASFDTHSGRGTGRYNGADGATVEWTFTDAGEPGAADTARLVIRDASGRIVLEVSGQLSKGNNQAHDDAR